MASIAQTAQTWHVKWGKVQFGTLGLSLPWDLFDYPLTYQNSFDTSGLWDRFNSESGASDILIVFLASVQLI